VADPRFAAAPGYLPPVRDFFDRQYAAHDRYWWRGANRYSTDPADHTAFNAAWLTAAAQRGPGRALDLGCEPIETASLEGNYDVVLMNGCLHYVSDKNSVLTRVTTVSAADAVHAVAVFSTATPIPSEHAVIPTFPDEEGGTVEQFYNGWRARLRFYERDRAEHSHPGFAPHAHSHIKLIAERQPERNTSR
jgi:hypothetical protein